MRARLHARGDRVGSYREGTHELCDMRSTGQLSEAAVDAVERAVRSLVQANCAVDSVVVMENIAADERVLHVVAAGGADPAAELLDAAMKAGDLTGCTVFTAAGSVRTAGVPVVSDPLTVLTGGRATTGALERHAESFFQANRFLLPRLVEAVMDAVPPDGALLDLYAGVGLFSISLAGAGRERITAVEGDRTSGRDLQRNASATGAAVRVMIESVEDYLARGKSGTPAIIIVDPPRTGISRQAMEAAVRVAAPRVVYVSCDPPTMARDARRLLDGGYRLSSLHAFDLFPNTPHVETLGVFER
jgi:23S rRNA (uracil1939-C5)-methyltransferase